MVKQFYIIFYTREKTPKVKIPLVKSHEDEEHSESRITFRLMNLVDIGAIRT